jgi:uncharacterized protein YjiK
MAVGQAIGIDDCFSMNNYILCLMMLFATGCSSARTETTNWPLHQLVLLEETRLTPPKDLVFQASGLALDQEGRLLTVHDRQSIVYQIVPSADTHEAQLVAFENHFTEFVQAKAMRNGTKRFDCEGVALDEQGNVYLCEESERRVLRFNPITGKVEPLKIDWTPVETYFSKLDNNASFEGIAVSGDRLYLANERSDPVIVVVDLPTRKVVDQFVVHPRTRNLLGMHYSGLAAHGGRLFILLRQHRVVLEVNPGTKTVVAEYNYRTAEDSLNYTKSFPVGIMEGLAVDDDYFWLVTDNNGKPREGTNDRRPTLLKFRRPVR